MSPAESRNPTPSSPEAVPSQSAETSQHATGPDVPGPADPESRAPAPTADEPPRTEPPWHERREREPTAHQRTGHEPARAEPTGHELPEREPTGHERTGHEPAGAEPAGTDGAGHGPARGGPIGGEPGGPAWNGWEPGAAPALPARTRRALARLLGAAADTPSVPVSEVRLPPSALPAYTRRRFVELLGAEHVRTDRAARLAHAGGRSYLDLIRLRGGDASGAPDAVLTPAADEIPAVLAACVDTDTAVVPYGGGTSVVGGVSGADRGHAAVVALDLSRLNRLVALDEVAQTATFGAGMRGPDVERALAHRGYTLGHFPQSYRYSTLGGWVATRSAGQASTGYGRIDELVHALRCVTPTGELRLGRGPASAAGPDLLALVVGSEGALGVITEATLTVRRIPPQRRYEGWSLPDLPAGLSALREMAQRLGPGLAPDVCRLSDPDETRSTFLLSGSLPTRLVRGYLAARGRNPGCLAIFGWEGEPGQVAFRHRAATRVLRAHGGVSLGAAAGRSWLHGRFAAPNLRDTLLDHGLLVETLETAAGFGELPQLYARIRRSLRDSLGRVMVLSHVSHLYRGGASLYVTVLAARDPADPVGQWTAAKRAVTETILAAGGTLTHHHAVGTDHRDFLGAEIGTAGLSVLRGVKATLDPTGIMNPGTLLTPPS
ncbi:FAD-linked oxidase C-terminal domain-containing protein [Actinocatenispora sera]|uniref:FAD-linked oxidase C-terminal domain-containing protein n=1 Tax=Actinocatenispora sera TaxID=390989 RepID=UPI0033F1FADE